MAAWLGNSMFSIRLRSHQGPAGGLVVAHVGPLQRRAAVEDAEPLGGPARAALRLAPGPDGRLLRRAQRLRAAACAAEPADPAGTRPTSALGMWNRSGKPVAL